MTINNLHISDPQILRQLFSKIIFGDVVSSSKIGSPSIVSLNELSPHLSLIWGNYSYISGIWQTTGGIFLSISTDDIPFYFNGKSVGNLSNPLELTLTHPGQKIDFSFKYPYRSLVLYLDSTHYINTYERLTGKTYDTDAQHNLLNLRSEKVKHHLLSLLMPLTHESDQNTSAQLDSLSRASAAQEIIEALILSIDYDQPGILDRSTCNYLAVRAHALILSEPNRALTLTEISESLHAPLRSIQQGFTALYGAPIIEYHRRFRLLSMRDHILKYESDKISNVAKQFGFAHAGRLSQSYKDEFGILPSRDSTSVYSQSLHDHGLDTLLESDCAALT